MSSRHPQRRRGDGSAAPTTRADARTPTAPASPPTPEGAIDTWLLAKDYGDRPALHPLTVSVPGGQRVAVVGHNGSGKTTLLRLLAGLLDPSGGAAHVMGHPVGSPAARAAVSYLSDTPTFYDDLSLWEHLEYVARMHMVDEWEQAAADLLGHVGLFERGDDLPTSFSRGLRQKAAIALAFVRPFDILLVDEPFVGLDASGKEALLELFETAWSDGATVIVATHELSFVERVDRLVALRDGAVVHDGAPGAADLGALVSSA